MTAHLHILVLFFRVKYFGLIYLRENNNASPNAVYNHGSIKRGGRGEYI